MVYALKTSVKHDFEEILDVYSNKINEPVEILLVGNDPKFMRELIATFERSKLITSIRFTGAVEEAREMIFQQGVYEDFPIANIIIFDFPTLEEKGWVKSFRRDHGKKECNKECTCDYFK